MTEKEPDDDPFDLSNLPDLDLDAESSADDGFPGLDPLEPLTEAAAESPEVRPEPAVDEIPDLPVEAEIVPAAPKPAPRPKSEPPKRAPRPEPPARAAATPPTPPQASASASPAKPAAPPAAAKPAPPKPVTKPPTRPPVAPAKPKAPAPVVAKKVAPKIEKPEKLATAKPKPEKVAEPAVAAEAAPEASPRAAGDVTTTADGVVVRRELDQAPLHLRKAAWIVVIGSVLPWMGSVGGWISLGGSKVLVALGAWLLYQTVEHKAGGKVPGFVTKLISIRFAKDSGKRKKSIVEQVLLTVPTPAHALGLGILLFGVFSATLDPAFVATGSGLSWFPDHPANIYKAFAELGMFAWAAGTIVHIDAYVHGGKFNPIFPLMFLGMAVAGVIGVIGGIAAFGIDGANAAGISIGIAGSAVVAVGGVLAGYTMFEAMKQAKVEGEAKKAAAREARTAARRAKKS